MVKKREKVITDFLKTTRKKEDLQIALEVLKEFKGCESLDEWAFTYFHNWIKFEQFEEFLEHLVNGKELQEDTKEYIKNSEKT